MKMIKLAAEPIQNYLKILFKILTHPSDFFKNFEPLYPNGYRQKYPLGFYEKVTYAVAFAVITHWISSSIHFLWNLLFIKNLKQYTDTLSQILGDVFDLNYPGASSALLSFKEIFSGWFTSVAPILIDPFSTLFSIFFYSSLIWMGARILIDSHHKKVTYVLILQIYCYSMAASLFSVIPIFGSPLAFLFTAIIRIIALKEIFQISTTRALFVGAFPLVLTFILTLSFVCILLLSAFKMFWTVFF